MSFNPTGVIEKATGDLLRWGFVDWANDGQFDSVTEEVKTSLPGSPKARKQHNETKFHRWNGSSWDEVDQPVKKYSYDANGGMLVVDIMFDPNYFVHILLKATTTIDFTNPHENGFVTVLVEQDSAGLHRILFDLAKIKVDFSLAQLNLAPNGKTTFSFITRNGILHMNSAVHAIK